MSKAIIVIIVIFLLIGISIPFLFFLQEKPTVEKIPDTYNISLRYFFDNGSQTNANVYVFLGNQLIKSFNSSLDAYSFLTLPANNTYFIYGIKDGFYINKQEINTFYGDKLIRKDFYLIPFGNIDLKASTSLSQMSDIYLSINVTGLLQEGVACIRWSNNIISTNIINANETNKPKRIEEKVDKCYLLNNIEDTNKVLDLKFKTFLGINDADFINLFIIDRDYDIKTGYLTAEDSDGNDIGIKDMNLTIRY